LEIFKLLPFHSLTPLSSLHIFIKIIIIMNYTT
jgi:hypothetical protein